MDAIEAVRVYTALQAQDMPVRIEGGWAVDALLHIHNPHDDLDLLVGNEYESQCRKIMPEMDYSLSRDKTPSKLDFRDDKKHKVTIHFGSISNGTLRRKTSTEVFVYSTEAVEGRINGTGVRCVTPKDLLERYKGSTRDKDRKYCQLLQNYLDSYNNS